MPRYIKDKRKLVDAGIQLHTPPDLVPATQYTRLNNVLPKTEGILQTRDGLTSIATVLTANELHSIFRLNQEVDAVNGERLVGVATQLFTAPLPAGSVFTELTGLSYDGKRLSIISFRFTNDIASWAIIANANGMRKRRDGYYQDLGLPPSTVAATASDGGAGNLDSTGGTEYDWRYTYVNEVTNTESNPSPTNVSGGNTETLRPSAETNPATGGNTAFTNPANAYDANAATFAFAQVVADTIDTADVLWTTWGAATITYNNLTLRLDSQVLLGNLPFPDMSATLEYSTDSGLTFKTVYSVVTARARQTDEIILQPNMDLSKLRVRATVANISVDGGVTDTMTLRVHEIDTLGTIDTAGTLALVNKQADVCVESPTDAQETAIRLYRRGGTLPNNWNRVGHFPTSTLVQGGCGAGFLEIVDNIADVDLGSTLELDN
ncbi:hypothetical protein LCGC14_2473510, partial [marine sediment metagenome]